MRRVLHGDLVQLGRVLLICPPEERAALVTRAFDEAALAERYRRQFGLWHPQFGDGSLAGWAASRVRPPAPDLDDPEFATCLALILTRLAGSADDAETRRVNFA